MSRPHSKLSLTFLTEENKMQIISYLKFQIYLLLRITWSYISMTEIRKLETNCIQVWYLPLNRVEILSLCSVTHFPKANSAEVKLKLPVSNLYSQLHSTFYAQSKNPIYLFGKLVLSLLSSSGSDTNSC